MRIVLLDKEEPFGVSGAAVFTQRFYNHLVKAGHTVFFIRFSNTPSTQPDIYTIPYYFAEPRTYIFGPSLKTLDLMRQYLTQIKPDIVYGWAALTPFDYIVPSLCHRLHIPISGVWHMDLNPNRLSYQFFLKLAFLSYVPVCRQLDLLHVFSDRLKSFFTEKGVKSENILVLPNGINSSVYTPGTSHFKQKHHIQKALIFIGRLTFQKNPELLIRSFLKLNPSVDTKLILVGSGELETLLRKKYTDPRIIFTGLVTDEKQKIDIMRAGKISVLPSRFEGASLSLLEAMSCGMACIVSDVGNNANTVGDTGIIVSPNTLEQSLPYAINSLLTNPRRAETLGHLSRERIKTRFDQKMLFDKLVSALEETARHFSL